MKKMIILDGNSVMFRAYYATAYTGNLMQSRSGLYTNAIYGFVNMIEHILQTKDMTNIFVAFDKGKKTLRHQSYEDYKGGRKKTPDEFLMQIPYIKEYLDVLGIKHLELDDYEADDIVGSMAMKMKDHFDEIMVISGDKDLLQLAKGNIHVYLTKKGLTDLDEYTEENFYEKMGIQSSQMIDYKGLIGDSSDNLPGISGIGPKTACKLLEEYITLEGIIDAAPQMKGKTKDAILQDKEIALRSKKLATLYTDVDLPFDLADTVYEKPNYSLLRAFYEKLDFNAFIKRLNTKMASESEEKELLVSNKEESIIYIKNNPLKFIEHAKQTKTMLLDVLLTGENYHNESLVGLITEVENTVYYINKEEINEEISQILEDESITKYLIDYKKTYVALKKREITLNGVGYDFMLGIYIVNPAYSSVDIKDAIKHFVDINMVSLEEIVGKKDQYDLTNLDKVIDYYMMRITYLPKVKEIIDEKLEEINCTKLLHEVEIPLARVLGDMELAGFKINKTRLEEIGTTLTEEMNRLEQEIYDLSGMIFNIGSPKQLGEVLFEKLAIAKGKKNKTGYSTSAEVLEKLAPLHPVPQKVLEYRKYSKLYSTYVAGLINVLKEDEKVHTIFKQALTLTGRLSSTEPNIQNIPIRTDEGRLIRSAFIPSFEGGKLVSADYSQIELRILSHMANCKNMLQAFNTGLDLHASTASNIYGCAMNDVTKEMRRTAKAVNFGIVYGISAWGLADDLGILAIEANNFIERYFEIYPEIRTFLDNVVKQAKKDGYTTTIFNRRRYMPEINSTNGALRQFAERTAKNAPIQGSAADIIKIAMIEVDRKIKQANLKSKLIAQVHDELVIDTHPDEVEVIKQILKETMERVVSLNVSLNAELEEGFNWDMK